MPGTNLTQQEAIERRAVVAGRPDYRISLDVTKGPDTFPSSTTITFDAAPGASTFLDLTADEVVSVTLNGTALDPAEAYADSRVTLPDLREHNVVTVEAVCRYSKTGEGLQRSVDPADGNVYLYTQFEVPDARRAFAVFDQPDIKSTFTFDVAAPASWLALSNTPVAACEDVPGALTEPGTLVDRPAEGVRRWTFETTPVMSSYLTALAIGPYAERRSSYANADGRTIAMGLYCRQSLEDALDRDAEYLFDVTKKGMTFFAAQWDVPYPYAKYDQVFAPEYSSGAMENIGLVVVHDRFMFSSKVDAGDLEDRDRTLLHELAHMWFGDLVTMKWWNDLWLNESFATFMGYLAGCEAAGWPDDWSSFCSCQKYGALDADQRPTTHPVVAPIHDLNDTYVNFDSITYTKGAAVLKQMVYYVGREAFFKGIHDYLTRLAYGNATLDDLLESLQRASGRPMRDWAERWLEHAGMTMVEADADTAADGTISRLTLRQSAPGERPVLRPHRIAVGFYDLDEVSGRVTRTARFELDLDGATADVPEAVGLRRPDVILVNDDDLTYTKIRLDERSRDFAAEHLAQFADPLARAVIWQSFWSMTRDGEFPAERFIDLTLRALPTEDQAATFTYSMREMQITAQHYVPAARRVATMRRISEEVWRQIGEAKPGSGQQFQLLTAYLAKYAADHGFEAHARGLLDGTVALEGIEIDDGMRWKILRALAARGFLSEADVDTELAKADTSKNRENALAAKAAIPTAEAKAKYWDLMLHDESLAHTQLWEMAPAFNSDLGCEDLYEPYAQRYFDEAEWIWTHRSFHVADVLLRFLYPEHAPAALLTKLGDEWLAAHPAGKTDAALRRLVIDAVDGSRRAAHAEAANN
ncbi:aminopeptidase N [Bifidobacterium ramosum]|uniref:Aminopeptidase N n=1 Tax=Bifidobacterium ramosum TaxID=1798158 RepID=A0A6L4X1S4_9BIFI|nr:aminopeptidase N [Bifidobacterium ramosum]KAB8289049.1 aminopeptidase N [Bifidobacterium ramosum]NEG70763.1 aminopeptidase N [Bifidobacterium ramosum]